MQRVFVLALGFIILIIDQLTKYYAEAHLVLAQPIEVIPDLFNLTLVYNPGAAFGLFGGLPDGIRRPVLFGVSFAAFVVVYVMYRDSKEDPYSVAALSLIVSGAIGNMIDRVRYDAVVDFLDFHWNGYHWPAFNVADSAICVGVAILLIRMLFFAPHPEQATSEDS